MLAAIPSPSSDVVPVLGIRWYGVMIALGVLAAVMLARRRWGARHHDPDEVADVAVVAVPAGLVGARLYHVITDNELYRGHWIDAFKIWNGGLGIPGGILFGVLGGVWMARRRGIGVAALADAMVPAIPLAQAIGRFGNYFNQELYGRPTTVPWAIRIDPAHRTSRYAEFATFHPTFAYEALWNLLGVALLIWVDSKRSLRLGKILPLFVAWYFTGRLWVESMRSDAANRILGWRVNTWTSLIMMGVGLLWLLWGGAFRPASERGTPHPDEVEGAEAEREARAEQLVIERVADGGRSTAPGAEADEAAGDGDGVSGAGEDDAGATVGDQADVADVASGLPEPPVPESGP
ncbi:MAG: prolipoprotein diacylglyceryl transferase [Microthrixaceae bacterium]